jgi:predicted transcriptional regulator
MKLRLASLAVALMAVSAPSMAADNCEELAQEIGLTERQVQMILGNRTSYAEYRTSYNSSVRKMQNAIGRDRYDQMLSSGRFADVSVDAKAQALLAVIEENHKNATTP